MRVGYFSRPGLQKNRDHHQSHFRDINGMAQLIGIVRAQMIVQTKFGDGSMTEATTTLTRAASRARCIHASKVASTVMSCLGPCRFQHCFYAREQLMQLSHRSLRLRQVVPGCLMFQFLAQLGKSCRAYHAGRGFCMVPQGA